jgi:FK506-binding nuclear protein
LRITNVALSDELADANGRTSLKLTYASPGAVDDDEDEDDDEEEEPKLVTTVLTSLTPGKVSRIIMRLNISSLLLLD